MRVSRNSRGLAGGLDFFNLEICREEGEMERCNGGSNTVSIDRQCQFKNMDIAQEAKTRSKTKEPDA